MIEGTRSDGRLFRNPLFSLQFSDSHNVTIASTGGSGSFEELRNLRRSSENQVPLQETLNRISSKEGHVLSNVGVSVVVTTEFKGNRYAVMQFREGTGALGLLSGYVDSASYEGGKIASAGAMSAHAIEELRQEFVPALKPGIVGQGFASGALIRKMLGELVVAMDETVTPANGTMLDLGRPYASLDYTSAFNHAWSVRSTRQPSYLFNTSDVGTVSVDGHTLPQTSFQYVPAWNAGQLFFSFDLDLPIDQKGLFLFHAEDGPIRGAAPWELETQLNANNLVLVKLDEAGFLTEETYHMRAGVLVPRGGFSESNILLSEAFSIPADGNPQYRGIGSEKMVPMSDYRRSAEQIAANQQNRTRVYR